MEQNKNAVTQWSDSARYWEKHRAVIREMFDPVTQALIEEARIARSSSVLDVATGPGEPALSVAEFVGPEGKVVGTDIILEMVEAARREGDKRKLQNLSFQVAFSENLPFPPDTFDAAVSRFGVMFFPSPLDAVRDILRVLKPGGGFAFAVWAAESQNPFHYVISDVVGKYVDAPPPQPDTFDAFRFSKPGELLQIVRNAGANSASERLLRFSIRAPLSAEDYWMLRSEMSDKFRKKVSLLSPQILEQLTRDATDAIRRYSLEGGIVFPSEVLIVSGRKSYT